MFRWLYFMILLSCASSRLNANELPTFTLESERFDLVNSVLFDLGIYDQELSAAQIIEKIQSKSYIESDEYHIDNKKYSYWLYFLDNNTDRPQDIYVRYPLQFYEAKFWVYEAGALRSFSRYPVGFDAFYGEIPRGRSVLIAMRLSGGKVRGKASVVAIADFLTFSRYVVFDQSIYSIVLGAVGIMIFYNIGMFFSFRRLYFLYYAIYSAAAMICFSIFSGYIVWSVPTLGLGVAVAGAALVQFCISSLSLPTSHPRLYRIAQGLLAYILLFGAYAWIATDWRAVAISMPLGLGFSAFVCLRRAWQGYKPAYNMLIGWSFFLVAVSLQVLNVSHISIQNAGHFSLIGFALEVCFFSFAIGQKVRIAEQKALGESKHAFNQLKKVFYPHQISQIRNGKELEGTMPTGKGKASVICFDIIGSSKIAQPMAKSFIEASIKSCVSVISENYDPDSLTANGYRIKEVGDGFLCSVGYPFRVPQGLSSAQVAIEMALRFVKMFQNEVDLLNDHHPVFCSIGVAIDYLEGYYPKVGTIEYDVYGRAIILASRYEFLRKQLFPDGPHGHIITIHEKVFELLTPRLQLSFVEVDLRKKHLSVRDDLRAGKVYYRIISGEEATISLDLAG